MDKQIQAPEVKISARRRLVRGAFAAPAALTLFSGSLAARSINHCVVREVTSDPQFPIPASTNATYVRVRLRKFRGRSNGEILTNRYSRWIQGSDVVNLRAPGTSDPYLATNQWQLYDRGTTNATTRCDAGNFNPASKYASTGVGTIINTAPDESGTVTCGNGITKDVNAARTLNDEWVALRIDADGNIVGVSGINNTSGTSAIHQSCWTSFRVA